MKTTMSFPELLDTINNQVTEDYVADSRKVQFTAITGRLEVMGLGDSRMPVTHAAHRQLGSLIDMKAKYYDKCRNVSPALLAMNLNEWFQNPYEFKNGTWEKVDKVIKMFRCMKNDVNSEMHLRAVVSDRYQRIDHKDVLQSIAPIFQQFPGLKFKSVHLSETKLFLKAFWEGNRKVIPGAARVGWLPKEQQDIIEAGVCIQNSETGHVSYRIDPEAYRLICDNGYVINEYATRKNHAGKKIGISDNGVAELLTDETLAATDRAILMQARDVVKATLQGVWLDKVVNQFAAKKGIIIEDVPAAVKKVAKHFSLNEAEEALTLEHFYKGDALSTEQNTEFRLINAVTAAAQEVEDYERSHAMEEAGGKLLTMAMFS